MERFAQILDDCDDLLHALPLLWESIRRVLLQIGLTAAIGVPLAELLASPWANLLAAVALTVSGGWLLAVAVSQAARIRRDGIGADTP